MSDSAKELQTIILKISDESNSKYLKEWLEVEFKKIDEEGWKQYEAELIDLKAKNSDLMKKIKALILRCQVNIRVVDELKQDLIKLHRKFSKQEHQYLKDPDLILHFRSQIKPEIPATSHLRELIRKRVDYKIGKYRHQLSPHERRKEREIV